ncbi:hypothetical transcriptional regulator [Photobacterium profundum SS9]|uniref:Hypothetical transcriptional regulator n=1 Tax=Photobacterium profundum (strain SS9) TaxID=298386 RepID=Q6LGS2_PHOPR|nr:hypothetical transcriptional regulator [Photobacterium profundum SS9]
MFPFKFGVGHRVAGWERRNSEPRLNYLQQRRGTKLSPAGKAIYPEVQRFVNHMATLERVVYEVAKRQSGFLQIGAVSTAMLDIVPSMLNYMKKDFPDSTAFVREIDSVEATADLASGKLDMAFIRWHGEVNEGISIMPLVEELLAVALPKEHYLADQHTISLSSLIDLPLVATSRSISPAYFDLITSSCNAQGYGRLPCITIRYGDMLIWCDEPWAFICRYNQQSSYIRTRASVVVNFWYRLSQCSVGDIGNVWFKSIDATVTLAITSNSSFRCCLFNLVWPTFTKNAFNVT